MVDAVLSVSFFFLLFLFRTGSCDVEQQQQQKKDLASELITREEWFFIFYSLLLSNPIDDGK